MSKKDVLRYILSGVLYSSVTLGFILYDFNDWVLDYICPALLLVAFITWGCSLSIALRDLINLKYRIVPKPDGLYEPQFLTPLWLFIPYWRPLTYGYGTNIFTLFSTTWRARKLSVSRFMYKDTAISAIELHRSKLKERRTKLFNLKSKK